MSEPRAGYVVAGDDVAVPDRAVATTDAMSAPQLPYRVRREPPRTHLLLSPDDTETLRRCEATPVIGCEGLVDVRVPQSLWARIQAAMGD